MGNKATHDQVSDVLKDISELTTKWWIIPTFAALVSFFLQLLLLADSTSPWVIETLIVLVLVPVTLLGSVAIVFDILTKKRQTVPPGLYMYPVGMILGLVWSSLVLYGTVILYIAIWVWPGYHTEFTQI